MPNYEEDGRRFKFEEAFVLCPKKKNPCSKCTYGFLLQETNATRYAAKSAEIGITVSFPASLIADPKCPGFRAQLSVLRNRGTLG